VDAKGADRTVLTIAREAWKVADAGDVSRREKVGFYTVRSPDGRTWICVDDVSRMVLPAARRALLRAVGEATSRSHLLTVLLPGLTRGDDLVLAATVGLLLQFKWPRLDIRLEVDAHRIHDPLVERFTRAAAHPARLLRTLEQTTFARVHYLVGVGDDDGVARFAPRLPFVDIIADGDADLARRLARMLDIHKRNLQLMTTRRCHLRCVYCPVEKRDVDLDLAVAQQGVDLLLGSDNDSFRIDFTGGEPLLREAWVRQIIDYAHAGALRQSKRDSYYLVTNGLALTEDFCRYLSNFDVELEISIDGTEQAHNRNKIATDPTLNPYRTLLDNFRSVRAHDLHYNAVVVFTPDSLDRLTENLEHVLSLGFGNIAVNYAIGYHWSDEHIARYVEILAALVDRYDMLDRQTEAELFLKNLLHKTEPTVLNSELMLDTDGSLHLLSEWQFKARHRRQAPSLAYDLDSLTSIDDVYFTRAQVYHLLHEVYRDDDRELLRIIHNSVHTGVEVERLLRARLGDRLRAR
jgi:sulfatase maturation enzyme AslB (radical SAM superfamily)